MSLVKDRIVIRMHPFKNCSAEKISPFLESSIEILSKNKQKSPTDVWLFSSYRTTNRAAWMTCREWRILRENLSFDSIMKIGALLFVILLVDSYDILPESLKIQSQICRTNCSKNQTIDQRFDSLDQCSSNDFQLCQSRLLIDFENRLVFYEFQGNQSGTTNVFSNVTAVRSQQLTMKFLGKNSSRLKIEFCRTKVKKILEERAPFFRLSNANRWRKWEKEEQNSE